MQELFSIFENINVNIELISPQVLAYIGDAVYELYVTTKIVLESPKKLNELNEEAKKYVKASNQANIYKILEDKLTECEIEIYKRGRNTHGTKSSKSASVIDYRMATGLETLVGYLYLSKNYDRLNEIMKIILNYEGKIE